MIARLAVDDAGELLTVQRAAYVSESMVYEQFLPPLRETLDEVRTVLARDDVVVLGLREDRRLLGAVRVMPTRRGRAAVRRARPPGRRRRHRAAARGDRAPAAPGCSRASAAPATCACTRSTGSSRRAAKRPTTTTSCTCTSTEASDDHRPLAGQVAQRVELAAHGGAAAAAPGPAEEAARTLRIRADRERPEPRVDPRARLEDASPVVDRQIAGARARPGDGEPHAPAMAPACSPRSRTPAAPRHRRPARSCTRSPP